MGEIRASADESEPLVVTCVKMCMVQRKMELRDRVKDGEVDDKGDLKLVPCSKKSKAGTLHSDPTRIKKSTRAGLSKLTAGRPHLEVVKTRKEHEAPRNATRTTLDLRLS